MQTMSEFASRVVTGAHEVSPSSTLSSIKSMHTLGGSREQLVRRAEARSLSVLEELMEEAPVMSVLIVLDPVSSYSLQHLYPALSRLYSSHVSKTSESSPGPKTLSQIPPFLVLSLFPTAPDRFTDQHININRNSYDFSNLLSQFREQVAINSRKKYHKDTREFIDLLVNWSIPETGNIAEEFSHQIISLIQDTGIALKFVITESTSVSGPSGLISNGNGFVQAEPNADEVRQLIARVENALLLTSSELIITNPSQLNPSLLQRIAQVTDAVREIEEQASTQAGIGQPIAENEDKHRITILNKPSALIRSDTLKKFIEMKYEHLIMKSILIPEKVEAILLNIVKVDRTLDAASFLNTDRKLALQMFKGIMIDEITIQVLLTALCSNNDLDAIDMPAADYARETLKFIREAQAEFANAVTVDYLDSFELTEEHHSLIGTGIRFRINLDNSSSWTGIPLVVNYVLSNDLRPEAVGKTELIIRLKEKTRVQGKEIPMANYCVFQFFPLVTFYSSIVDKHTGLPTVLDFFCESDGKHNVMEIFRFSSYEEYLLDVLKPRMNQGFKFCSIDAALLGCKQSLIDGVSIDNSDHSVPELVDTVLADLRNRNDGNESSSPLFDRIKSQFLFSDNTMTAIIEAFMMEMQDGLAGGKKKLRSSLKMIPSYVTELPDGTENGIYYALDLGGTNFRVSCIELLGNGKSETRAEKKFKIPEAMMVVEHESMLFDYLVDCISETDEELKDKIALADLHSEEARKYGFTFSFPLEQYSITKGTLISWSKGFKIADAIGKDVVDMLTDAMERRKVGGAGQRKKILALVNDTVGTLAAGRYIDKECKIGIILGTGTNAAYIEKASNILTIPEDARRKFEDMAINIEWGAFGDKRKVLPTSIIDELIDEVSLNPGSQRFEKMISGLYLGEIFRQVLVYLIKGRELFIHLDHPREDAAFLFTPHSLESRTVSLLEFDHSDEALESARELLKVSLVTRADLNRIREVIGFVIERAVRLVAAGIIAILRHMAHNERGGRFHDSIGIGIDGSVFEHHPSFRQRLEKVMSRFGYNCKLFLAKDGSGQGAALVSAAVDKQSR